jgi:hypothetical protein
MVRGRPAQQRSVNHGALTFRSGGPCDRGNLCPRRPNRNGWRAKVGGQALGRGARRLGANARFVYQPTRRSSGLLRPLGSFGTSPEPRPSPLLAAPGIRTVSQLIARSRIMFHDRADGRVLLRRPAASCASPTQKGVTRRMEGLLFPQDHADPGQCTACCLEPVRGLKSLRQSLLVELSSTSCCDRTMQDKTSFSDYQASL